MPTVKERTPKIRVDGKSWVLRLPNSFADKNNLERGSEVLLTVKDNEVVSAEILPPLPDDLLESAKKILKKRSGAYQKLKDLGD